MRKAGAAAAQCCQRNIRVKKRHAARAARVRRQRV